jgi:hypothetical protein
MGANTRETIGKERSTERANTSGRTAATTTAVGRTTKSQDTGYTSGRTDAGTLETG